MQRPPVWHPLPDANPKPPLPRAESEFRQHLYLRTIRCHKEVSFKASCTTPWDCMAVGRSASLCRTPAHCFEPHAPCQLQQLQSRQHHFRRALLLRQQAWPRGLYLTKTCIPSKSSALLPEGPNTQYLRTLVPKAIVFISWYLGLKALNIRHLDPLGLARPADRACSRDGLVGRLICIHCSLCVAARTKQLLGGPG